MCYLPPSALASALPRRAAATGLRAAEAEAAVRPTWTDPRGSGLVCRPAGKSARCSVTLRPRKREPGLSASFRHQPPALSAFCMRRELNGALAVCAALGARPTARAWHGDMVKWCSIASFVLAERTEDGRASVPKERGAFHWRLYAHRSFGHSSPLLSSPLLSFSFVQRPCRLVRPRARPHTRHSISIPHATHTGPSPKSSAMVCHR